MQPLSSGGHWKRCRHSFPLNTRSNRFNDVRGHEYDYIVRAQIFGAEIIWCVEVKNRFTKTEEVLARSKRQSATSFSASDANISLLRLQYGCVMLASSLSTQLETPSSISLRFSSS